MCVMMFPTQWKIFSASWSDQESLLFAIASSWGSALYGWLTSPPGWPPMMSVIINDSVFSPAWGAWLKKSSGSSCIHISATVFQLLIWNLVVILVLTSYVSFTWGRMWLTGCRCFREESEGRCEIVGKRIWEAVSSS